MNYPPCLVLAKNYSPVQIFPKLSLINGEEAVRKYMNDKCSVLEFYDRPVLGTNGPIEYGSKGILFWPSVIVDHEQKIRDSIRLSLSVLYFREDCKCFWCQKPMSISKGTKDHVYPTSRGGTNTFDNVVFSCNPCNNEKGDSLPEGKWKPRYKPKKPTYGEVIEMRKKHEIQIFHEEWKKYLPNFANYSLIDLDQKKESDD